MSSTTDPGDLSASVHPTSHPLVAHCACLPLSVEFTDFRSSYW